MIELVAYGELKTEPWDKEKITSFTMLSEGKASMRVAVAAAATITSLFVDYGVDDWVRCHAILSQDGSYIDINLFQKSINTFPIPKPCSKDDEDYIRNVMLPVLRTGHIPKWLCLQLRDGVYKKVVLLTDKIKYAVENGNLAMADEAFSSLGHFSYGLRIVIEPYEK